MKPSALAKLRATLVELRARTIEAGPATIEPARKDGTAVGVHDEDEQALTEMNQILASERNKKQAQLIRQIDAALRRMDTAPDEFGVCEECEEDIPLRRLELMPHATLCADCQAARDPSRGGTRRSLTDYKK